MNRKTRKKYYRENSPICSQIREHKNRIESLKKKKGRVHELMDKYGEDNPRLVKVFNYIESLVNREVNSLMSYEASLSRKERKKAAWA